MKIERYSLAPIHEFTNSPFRLLCERYGCGMTFVPLVNTTSVIKGKNIPYISEGEKFASVQLSGSAPYEFERAIKVIESKYPFIKGININAGCPSKTTMKIGAGSALMRRADHLCEIVKKCKAATSLDVSVKIRVFSDSKKTLDLFSRIEESGADYIIIHGRTVKQGYSGKANWGIIKKAKEALAIPVIGNGDIKNLEEADQKIRDGYCDGVMIGRAALQNPMLFRGKNELSEQERKNLFFEYLEICRELKIDDIKEAKLISTQLFKGIRNASKLRNMIMKSKNLEELVAAIEK